MCLPHVARPTLRTLPPGLPCVQDAKPKRRSSIRESVQADVALLAQTVVLKLNGGLGTSMGLDKAKSLLPVKDGLSFLDLIAKQVQFIRGKTKEDINFMLMNSFSTSADTNAAFKQVDDCAIGFCRSPNCILLYSILNSAIGQRLN